MAKTHGKAYGKAYGQIHMAEPYGRAIWQGHTAFCHMAAAAAAATAAALISRSDTNFSQILTLKNVMFKIMKTQFIESIDSCP